jgi:hypothetical protein
MRELGVSNKKQSKKYAIPKSQLCRDLEKDFSAE